MASKATVAMWLVSTVNVERGLLHLFSLQTSDEQASTLTSHLNDKGFSQRTVKSGSYMARYVKGSSRPEGQRLTGQWIAKGREVCLHHWRQMGSVMAPTTPIIPLLTTKMGIEERFFRPTDTRNMVSEVTPLGPKGMKALISDFNPFCRYPVWPPCSAPLF